MADITQLIINAGGNNYLDTLLPYSILYFCQSLLGSICGAP